MGSPAKIVRQVTVQDLAMMARAVEHYRVRQQLYRTQLRGP